MTKERIEDFVDRHFYIMDINSFRNALMVSKKRHEESIKAAEEIEKTNLKHDPLVKDFLIMVEKQKIWRKKVEKRIEELTKKLEVNNE